MHVVEHVNIRACDKRTVMEAETLTEERIYSEHTKTKVAQAKVALESYYETFLSEHRDRQNR